MLRMLVAAVAVLGVALIWSLVRARKNQDAVIPSPPLQSGSYKPPLGSIIVHCDDEEQVTKVVTTAKYLATHIWTEEDGRSRLSGMLMIDAVYPHFIRMAELEPSSVEWISVLGEAARVAAEGGDKAVRAQGELVEELQKIRDETGEK